MTKFNCFIQKKKLYYIKWVKIMSFCKQNFIVTFLSSVYEEYEEYKAFMRFCERFFFLHTWFILHTL